MLSAGGHKLSRKLDHSLGMAACIDVPQIGLTTSGGMRWMLSPLKPHF